ncbi:MAG TPA: hypothetical protein VHA82_18050 [Ramlibacter sp.]|uniref:hypothetical protein n=1 Tax=Ramlibacter sp. TaxID=1917967 RepID=UPI002B6B4F96|nr:hypothetical protein [Ramlibacter sp.]HVZ45716.1 hypothetical protein [Ramlibacter sp.]
MKRRIRAAAAAALAVPTCALACASSVEEVAALLGEKRLPQAWVETSMADGKPLVMSLAQRDGVLFMQFYKTHEGLWAQGPVAVCASNDEVVAEIAPGRVALGPAAHWLLRQALANGARFRLARLGRRLRVATTGWSGIFAPAE